MELCQLKDHCTFFRQDKTRQAGLLLVQILLNMSLLLVCESCLIIVFLTFVL